MRKLWFIFLLLPFDRINSQDTITSLQVNAYVETYYLFALKSQVNSQPAFVFSHNRHNEFNLNLGYVKSNYSTKRVRASLAIGAGTYMNANYAAEPGVLKNLFEASVGIKIGSKNVWLDAGVPPSHIGFESAVSKDCWNLTRSILADNSPYFQGAVRLSYGPDNGKWYLGVLALNGWQRITRVPGNSMMSWGSQVQFKPNNRLLINSSLFYGTDKPDSARCKRIFHNFYGVFGLSKKFGLTLGVDAGVEEQTPYSKKWSSWYATVLALKFEFNDKWNVAARGEYFNDRNGIIITTAAANDFETTGLSLNIDHKPARDIVTRIEIRNFNSRYPVFGIAGRWRRDHTFLTSSIAVSF